MLVACCIPKLGNDFRPPIDEDSGEDDADAEEVVVENG